MSTEKKTSAVITSRNRLLIVDDEQDICEFISEIGRTVGFEVTFISDPSEFLWSLRTHAPTAIILDMVMPNADGIELLRMLADRKSEAQILIMSGVDDRVLATARRLGASRGLNMLGVVKKPIMIQDLEAALRKAWHAPITEENLNEAIEAGQLTLHYQPKVNLASRPVGIIEAAECLVRWRHPQYGILMPEAFIAMAEKGRVILPLTENVFESAAKQARTWLDEGFSPVLSINLAPSLLRRLKLPDRFAELLQTYGVESSRIVLEITERAGIVDAERTMDILARFRLKGMGLSIDDFGIGYSSLVQLYRMPFNELKIDKSLIVDVDRDEEAKVIVRSIVDLAHNLGLEVCAEGVETRKAMEFLRALGCDTVQGDFISRPVPPADFVSFVRKWNKKGSRT